MSRGFFPIVDLVYCLYYVNWVPEITWESACLHVGH